MTSITKEEQKDLLPIIAEESGLNSVLRFKGQSNARHYESYRFYRDSGLYGIEFWNNPANGFGFYGDSDFLHSVAHVFEDHPKLKRIHGRHIEFFIDVDPVEVCKMLISHLEVNEHDSDSESSDRDAIEKQSYDNLDALAQWRYDEIDRIKTAINHIFGGKALFAFEHARSIKAHGADAIHPDNIQLLVQRENSVKNGSSMDRMNWDEQVEEIEFYMTRRRYNLNDSQMMIVRRLIAQLETVY